MVKKVHLISPREEAAKPKGLAAPLQNWDTLLGYFRTATENELWKLLDYETRHRKRISFCMRIYGRACDERAKREKRQIFAVLAK